MDATRELSGGRSQDKRSGKSCLRNAVGWLEMLGWMNPREDCDHHQPTHNRVVATCIITLGLSFDTPVLRGSQIQEAGGV